MAWNTRGLRGSLFEELIDMTNQLYRQKGLALIQKVPTPITPIAVDNKAHTITHAYFEKKSTVDFIGAAQGLPICFDAKETRRLSLPLRNIHDHQVEFMQDFTRQKGMAFLLVHFQEKNEMFLLPCETIAAAKKNEKNGGRKSIPYKDFNSRLLVQNKNGFPVHYLTAINEYIKIRGE
ncbi:MAG: Holliday junction resolvase RecU [Defluviitaleaceae bacterium]|nr:Holliday junction resolvase RecU [Defluviitaleaceae bacterium]MCL2273992.1 Holliday junction resolvase RecU [Defluviitaleaceae bacterium]MCL2274107.1 Holliday junction resolvase RecU [Defluviitaleaceae bacterium]